jgi:hypothetical protein
MAKLGRSAFVVAISACLLTGCVSDPPRFSASLPEIVAPACDTSIEYVDLVGIVRNTENRTVAFHLDDHRGPPFDLWYMGYTVYAGTPGKPFQVVHYSGHDSEWDRSMAIAPGESGAFTIPVFGLRPADYYHYFQIELRDSERRSYWTPVFELCAFARRCACPQPAVIGAAPPTCPVVPITSASGEKLGDIGVACR